MTGLIEKVIQGCDPRQALDEEITKGMANAYRRQKLKFVCSDPNCHLSVPHYAGRYPSKCPKCGADLTTPNKKDG